MPPANVGTKWVAGVLQFFNRVTGDSILGIDPDGDVELGTAQFIEGLDFHSHYSASCYS